MSDGPDPIDTRLVRRLAGILNDPGLSEIAVETQPVGETLPPGDVVKSPMVGTIYLQSQPGSPPFVKVGDKVTQGQTLLIIEAMKTMNPIPAPKGGVVRAILAE